jgi:hypothetical protein
MNKVMMDTVETVMRGIALDRFGGADELRLQTLPIPEIEPSEVFPIEQAVEAHLALDQHYPGKLALRISS